MLEQLGVLYRGLLLGLMVSAPVGPVGLLCIRRTIHKGPLIGFATGFGAAFADAFFSAVAAFGVAAIMEWVKEYNLSIYVLGGAFMLFIAYHAWHDKPKQPLPDDSDANGSEVKIGKVIGSALKAMASSFVITLTNPATLFGVLAAVATFGGLKNRFEAATLVGGIFIGSAMWWLMLSGGIALVRRRFTENSVMLINRITAVALALLALWALTSGIIGYVNELI